MYLIICVEWAVDQCSFCLLVPVICSPTVFMFYFFLSHVSRLVNADDDDVARCE